MAIAGLSLYQDARDPNSRWVQAQTNMGGGSAPIHSFRLTPEQAAQFEGAGLKYEKVFNMSPFAGYGGQVQDYNPDTFKSLLSEGPGYGNSPQYKDFFTKLSTSVPTTAGSDLAYNPGEQQRLVAGAWGGANNPISSGQAPMPGTAYTPEQAAAAEMQAKQLYPELAANPSLGFSNRVADGSGNLAPAPASGFQAAALPNVATPGQAPVAGAPTAPQQAQAAPQQTLKNPAIAAANESAIVNPNYINALYKEAYGRDATAAELGKFVGKTVKDAANLILGQGRSPFAQKQANQDMITGYDAREGSPTYGQEMQVQRGAYVPGVSATPPPVKPEKIEEKTKDLNDTLVGTGVTASPPSPTKSPEVQVQEIVDGLAKQAGLANFTVKMEANAKEQTDIKNERDKKILDINDNPWLSEASRQRAVDKMTNLYADKLKNKEAEFAIMQGQYKLVSDQVQFIAGKAIDLYQSQEKDRQFYISQAVEMEKAKATLNKPVEVSAGATLYDPKTGKAIFTAPGQERAPTSDIQNYEYAVGQGYKGTIEQWRTEDANRKALVDRTLAGLSPAAQSAAFKLADDYEKASKDIATQVGAYNKIQAAAKNPSAAGDLSLIFSYMKLLDPTSVVREQEFANAQNATGVPDRIRNVWNNLLSGQRLNENQRKDFLNTSKTLYDSAQKQQNVINQQFSDRANQWGVPPSLVVRSQQSYLNTGESFSAGAGAQNEWSGAGSSNSSDPYSF